MTSGETFFFLLIGLALAYGVGCLGRKRKIGFGWAFFLSILNLFLGLIVTLCSKKKENDIDFVDINKEDTK
ncbi:MAG: hypothetical protein ACOYJE_03720 [Bacteroidaceae bacterium]|jgi:hypothetical protein